MTRSPVSAKTFTTSINYEECSGWRRHQQLERAAWLDLPICTTNHAGYIVIIVRHKIYKIRGRNCGEANPMIPSYFWITTTITLGRASLRTPGCTTRIERTGMRCERRTFAKLLLSLTSGAKSVLSGQRPPLFNHYIDRDSKTSIFGARHYSSSDVSRGGS